MILIDSSAWIEFDRATGSAIDEQLAGLMQGGADIAVTEPILMEVLAGARSDRSAWMLRRLLTSFRWIPAETATDFEAAARIYRACRQRGVTPRGLVDCMIAAIAIRSDSSVLTGDGDFAAIGRVVPLRLHPV